MVVGSFGTEIPRLWHGKYLDRGALKVRSHRGSRRHHGRKPSCCVSIAGHSERLITPTIGSIFFRQEDSGCGAICFS